MYAPRQAAYFSFSSFLQWADQPIYVLDKDNDLNIAEWVGWLVGWLRRFAGGCMVVEGGLQNACILGSGGWLAVGN